MKEWICKEVVALTMDGKVCGTMLNEEQELVRCKDCKHFDKSFSYDASQGYCSISEIRHDDNWFCANGERKKCDG